MSINKFNFHSTQLFMNDVVLFKLEMDSLMKLKIINWSNIIYVLSIQRHSNTHRTEITLEFSKHQFY